MLDIKIIKTENPQPKPAPGQKLGFGKIFSDHMFIVEYTTFHRWQPLPWKRAANL